MLLMPTVFVAMLMLTDVGCMACKLHGVGCISVAIFIALLFVKRDDFIMARNRRASTLAFLHTIQGSGKKAQRLIHYHKFNFMHNITHTNIIISLEDSYSSKYSKISIFSSNSPGSHYGSHRVNKSFSYLTSPGSIHCAAYSRY